MKYSQTIAYAIQATVLVADRRSNTPISSAQIASQGEMPERFLLRVLRGLVEAKILKSMRGSDGGYTLVRPPGTITLLEIIDAVSGLNSSGHRPRPVNRLPMDVQIAAAFDRATLAARQEIGKLTVADLISPGRQMRHPV